MDLFHCWVQTYLSIILEGQRIHARGPDLAPRPDVVYPVFKIEVDGSCESHDGSCGNCQNCFNISVITEPIHQKQKQA